jgi:predicted metal-dependent phosphotriesterase family hydrolase
MTVLCQQAPWGPNRVPHQKLTEDGFEHLPGRSASHFIIATDLGQTGNPVHPDGMVGMIEGMLAQGVTQADVTKMVKENPASLLGL